MRPFLIWRDDWLLGNESLDEQHLALAEKLNELHALLVNRGQGPRIGLNQLCRHLSELFEITRQHFKDEEVMMQAHDYPGWSEHHREHALLLAEMQECIREIEAGSKPFTLDALTALKYWQIDHVLNSDRHFADYLERQSVSANSRTAVKPGRLLPQSQQTGRQ